MEISRLIALGLATMQPVIAELRQAVTARRMDLGPDGQRDQWFDFQEGKIDGFFAGLRDLAAELYPNLWEPSMTPENQTEILVNCMKNGQMVYMTPMSEPEKNAIVAAVNAPKGTPEDPKIAEIKMNIYETIKAKDPEAAAQVKEIAAVAPNSVTKLDRRFALNSIKSINKFIFKLLGFAARVGFQVGWDIFKDSQGPYKGPRFPTGNKGRGPEYCPPKIKSQEECWKWFEAVEWTNIEQKKYRDTCENICNEEWPQDRGKKCAMRCKWGYFDKYKLDYWTNYESSISSAITTL